MRVWLSRQFGTPWVRWLVIFTLGVLIGTAAAERVRGQVKEMEVAAEVKAATEALWAENTALLDRFREAQSRLQELEAAKSGEGIPRAATAPPRPQPLPLPQAAPMEMIRPSRAG
ncbi:MAG: hypothetical protein FJX74_10110 [Armatimonadetes bacterium]|nr:hypothetical protein [Armatimonadota bacterium]